MSWQGFALPDALALPLAVVLQPGGSEGVERDLTKILWGLKPKTGEVPEKKSVQVPA